MTDGRRQLTTTRAIKSAIDFFYVQSTVESMAILYSRGAREDRIDKIFGQQSAREQKSAFAWARGDTGKGVCPASYKTLTDKV
jgi:hypothetical protein